MHTLVQSSTAPSRAYLPMHVCVRDGITVIAGTGMYTTRSGRPSAYLMSCFMLFSRAVLVEFAGVSFHQLIAPKNMCSPSGVTC